MQLGMIGLGRMGASMARRLMKAGHGCVAHDKRAGAVAASCAQGAVGASSLEDPQLEAFDGRVSDSGEGRWTIQAAIDEAVPTPVFSAALYERFASRGEAGFANQLLSPMRHAFGGHLEKPAEDTR